MASKDRSSADKGPARLIALLLKAADGDTAYRDLYLARAGAELAEAMPEREYRTLSTEQARVDALMRQTQMEVRNQNWERVKELSDQVERLRQALAQKADLLALAAAVYDADSVRIDPFSSGLSSFVLGPGETLASVRDGLVTVQVRAGEVTLDGRLDRRSAVELAGRLAGQVGGVVAVHNAIGYDVDDTTLRELDPVHATPVA